MAKPNAANVTSPIEAKRAEKAELEKELAEKQLQLERIESEPTRDYDHSQVQAESEKRLVYEISVLEAQLETLDAEIESSKLEQMASERTEAEKEAKEGDRMEQEGYELIVQGRAIKAAARERFMKNNPKVRIQTETRQILKMRRTVEETKFAGFTLKGDVIARKEKKDEETTIPALPANIEHAKSLGWEVIPGQRIEPEELTGENSHEEDQFVVPDIFFSPIVQ